MSLTPSQVEKGQAAIAAMQQAVGILQAWKPKNSPRGALEAVVHAIDLLQDLLLDLMDDPDVPPPPPPPLLQPSITNFTATPSLVTVGASVILNATVANAVSLTLDGAPVTLPKTIVPANTQAQQVVDTYTLVATGAAGTTPATATVSVTVNPVIVPPPPPPGPSGWTQGPSRHSGGTEADNTSWYNLAYDTLRKVHYAISWDRWLLALDPVTKLWTQVKHYPSANDVHNRCTAYDPINDRLWVTDGTGSAGGFQYIDLQTLDWLPMPVAWAGPSTAAFMEYDYIQRRLLAFGGWIPNPDQVLIFPISPIIGPAWGTNNTPNGPQWLTDGAKETCMRSDIDTHMHRLFYVDIDGSVWFQPLGLTGWQHVIPSGPKPPAALNACYCSTFNCIVVWSGSNHVVGGDGLGGTTRETWLMDLSVAPLVWIKAENIASGDVVPPASTMVFNAMDDDPVNGGIVLHTSEGDNFDERTWFYKPSKIGGVVSPPDVQPPPVIDPPPVVTDPPPPPLPIPTPPPTGIVIQGPWTIIPMPAMPSDGNATAPCTAGYVTKHVACAYYGGYIWMTGGDYTRAPYPDSYREETWKQSLTDFSFTLVDDYTGGARPPHPDTVGFFADIPRERFVLSPGLIMGTPGDQIWAMSFVGAWTQITSTGWNADGTNWGGVYDPTTDCYITFYISGNGFGAYYKKMVDPGNPANKAFYGAQGCDRITADVGFSRYAIDVAGRYIYLLANEMQDDGRITHAFLRWNIDSKAMERLPSMPLPAGAPRWLVPEACMLGFHNGKVVFPYTRPYGDEANTGALLNLFLYAPLNAAWSEDVLPTIGTKTMNCICSTPDGVMLFGGSFGPQQSHQYLYKVAA